MTINKTAVLLAFLLILFQVILVRAFEIESPGIGLFSFFFLLPFIVGFLYCLLSRKSISPEFSEEITRYYTLFLLIGILIPVSATIYKHGLPFKYELHILVGVLVGPIILAVLYFSTYLILIYSSRFYNFLRNLFVKS